MVNAERLLKFLLRATGIAMILGAGGVLMPRSWMAATHEWLGLGEFPDGVIVDYLARSLSALYAMGGGLVVLVAGDVRRHARVITYLAVIGIVFAVAISIINFLIGLPNYWTVGEFLSLFPLCVVVLVLLRNVRRSGESGTPAGRNS